MSKETKGRQRGFVSLCVYWWGKYNCHISPYWATSSRINTGIMQLHTVDKTTLGGIKTEDRDIKEQIESESRTGENLRDMFESL